LSLLSLLVAVVAAVEAADAVPALVVTFHLLSEKTVAAVIQQFRVLL
jgi:hypothetical protein